MTLYDEKQASLDAENIVYRHCRIGKVTRKLPKRSVFQYDGGLSWLSAWPFQPTGAYEGKTCGCRPGQACGNVACPHMLTVSNATFPAAFA